MKKVLKCMCIIIGIIMIADIAFHCMVKDFEVKSEDGKWSVHYVHFFRWDFPDYWEGYLVYHDNSTGDAGTVDWVESYGTEEFVQKDEEPRSFSEMTTIAERIAMGFSKPEKAYNGPGISGDDACETITIEWEENGDKQSTVIDVGAYINQTFFLKTYLKSEKLFEILFRDMANI